MSIRNISALSALIFCILAYFFFSCESFTKLSTYASILIGIAGLWLTAETLILARSIKEQRSASSLKLILANIIDDLGSKTKLKSAPTKDDIARVINFATLLGNNQSLLNDQELQNCINTLKGYEEATPRSNTLIVDNLNQIQNIIA